MSALTDDFDMALQVTEETIQRVVQARYKVGIINHKYIRNYYDKRVNLVINSPQVILTTSTGSDQLAVVTSRVFYNSRALNDNKDVGRDAVADVSVRANFKLSSGDPGLLNPDTRLIVDFSETQKDDIVVHDAPNDLKNEVKDVLLEFIGNGGGSFPIPPIRSSSYRVGSLAFRFNANTNKRFIVVGMNIGDTIKGFKDGLTAEFVQNDWSLALSDKYFLSKLRDRLRQSFPLPYKITRKCTGRSPFTDNCLNWMTVKMTSLNINLYGGKIKIDGKFDINNSFLLDTNASFEAFVTLSVGANQSFEVFIDEINVSMEDWWADAANFLSGNQFKKQIRDGIMSALQSVSAGSVTNFFTSEILASLGLISRRSLEIELQAMHITIRPDAVIIHGNLITPQLDTPPIAAITVIEVTEAPLHKILHAGESWAPNGTITNYHWEHSDGTSETYYDRYAKFVIDHVYNNKDWHTCLTVTDNLGRKTKIRKPDIQPYEPQYYPGSSIIAENRRRIMMGCAVKIMDLPYINVIDILGHRAPGSD
ncbi:hypothetical protein KAR91_45350, partial [Candidatus Pacearchaeota archaeon]|nr:hypothetical protein [Candidatus Pacearchaeota archaeon]